MAGEEADLPTAILEVQQALERLRIASLHSAPEWELVSEPPAGGDTARGSSDSPQPARGYPKAVPRPPPSRSSVEASFPDCPVYCLDLCTRLSAGESRAKRAWRAGCWAAEVLAERWPTPLSSPPLQVRPVVYVVLRADRLSAPARFSTFSALRQAVGEIAGSSTVCHSFGSLAEARVYCYAAGVPFPSLQG